MPEVVGGVGAEPLSALLWGLFVGLIFSTVGAAGGILAGVGHISLFGIQQANTVKLMNQVLILTSTLIAVPSYWRQRRVIAPLALLLGAGSVVGALVGSSLSYRLLPDLRSYKPLFGVFTLVVALKILYDLFLSRGKDHVRTIEREIGARGESDLRTVRMGPGSFEFVFLDRVYSFSPLSPVVAGFFVAVVSSSLGVGGGFLLVPFMVSVLGIPMFLVPGTSALSILVTMVVSGGNYLKMGVQVNHALLGVETAGVLIGSLAGPHFSRLLGERKLRLLLGLLLLYIGLGYAFGSFVEEHFRIRVI